MNLTCYVIQGERGKLITSPARAGKPQGKLLELWVKESGKSECRPVMGWIGIERKRHHPARKRADFRMVFDHEIV